MAKKIITHNRLTSKQPLVVIIIVNWNKKELILRCLDTLKKNTSYKNYHVIVSDNGSTDGTREAIKKKYRWVHLLENESNLGFGLAHNRGMDLAKKTYDPDYYLSLNNDTEIHQKTWLQKLVETAESNKKIGIVGCKWTYKDGNLQHYAMNGQSYYVDKGVKTTLSKEEQKEANKKQELKYGGGALFIIKRSVVEKIGLFDKFDPYYGEEIDYSERVRKNGFKIVYDPRVTIIHLKAQSIDARKELRDWYFMKKHSIKVELLNYPWREVFYWWIVHFIAVFINKRGETVKINKDFYKRFFLLIKAFCVNLFDLKNTLSKRRHRDKNIWYVG